MLVLLVAISTISYAESLTPFQNSCAVCGILGYSLPLSPSGANSYSESYLPGYLFGGGIKYSLSNNFSLALFYENTSTPHRTQSSAYVSFNPIYLETEISVANTNTERFFIIAGAGYSKNKVEGSTSPQEWNGVNFIGGGGFEYMLNKKFSLEFNIKGFGFLPANKGDDILGFSSFTCVINYYLI